MEEETEKEQPQVNRKTRECSLIEMKIQRSYLLINTQSSSKRKTEKHPLSLGNMGSINN